MTERRGLRRYALGASALGLGIGLMLVVLLLGADARPAMGASAPPENLRPPAITGKTQVGQVLRVRVGRWRPAPGDRPVYAFQWRVCEAAASVCTDVAGANDSIYAVRQADVGRALRVVVTAALAAGTATPASSAPTAPVAPARVDAPVAGVRPTIAGTALPGEVLTASPGTWTGRAPVTLQYRWRVCDALGGACRDTRQKGSTYVIRRQDVDHALRVLVTAKNAVATSAALSDPTQAVTGPVPPGVQPPKPIAEPAVSGTPQVGNVLRASRGTWTGSQPLRFAYRWRQCHGPGKPDASDCAVIGDARKATYLVRGADAGAQLRAQVIATNRAGSATSTSNATGVVRAATPAATAPKPTREPVISGTPREGQVLRTTSGRWAGTAPITFAYQWLRCGPGGGRPDGADCPAIPSATTTAYVPGSSDVGQRLRVRVTAKNVAGTRAVASNATPAIQRSAASGPPRNTSEPSISGSPTQGQTLSASGGGWVGAAPIGYEYQWLRCGADGGRQDGSNCPAIAGATGTRYVPTAGDVGHRLRVRVTARNARGAVTVASNATATIAARAPELPPGAVRLPDGRYSIPVTSVSLPARLVVDRVSFRPNPVRTRRAVLELRVHVMDTRGYVVRDALVFARSTPLVTSASGEPRTGTDGWATMRMAPQADFPIRSGYSVQFFVRARKPGENLLGGVSTRRLVQVRTAR